MTQASDIDAARHKFYSTGLSLLGLTKTTPEAESLEAQGWRVWLKTLAPRSFTSPFADEHIEFWDLFWSVLMRKKKGIEIPQEETNLLLLFHRGMGKSTSAEMAAIAEGCLLGEGFVLYLSDSQLLAEEHLFAVKAILETPVMAKYYPGMSKPKIHKGGSQAKFTQDTIICDNGWGMTARGITANVRGGRLGTLRFTLVINDDIDALTDSLAVIEKKKRIIARSVLPAMAKGALTIFAQNLITQNSVASQIFNGFTDILSERTIIGGGPVKAFKHLELQKVELPTGQTRWEIKSCVPSWEHFNLTDAKSFLSRSGREAFLAEYQHEFDSKRGKVISNYDPEAQIITWSEFEKVFGVRYIPQNWRGVVGCDIGYSDGMHPHYTAWMFLAVASLNSALPGAQFVYRSRTFQNTSIDEQAISIWRDLLPNADREFAEYATNFYEYPPLMEHFGQHEFKSEGFLYAFQLSHERTGEMMTLRQRYGLPFSKFKHWGKTDGIAQWNTLSLPDYSRPNPFKADTLEDDGKYAIGRPGLFYIVDDDQLENPRDDRGMMIFRRQVANWDYVQTKLTDTGLTEERPSKVDDDSCDALKAILHYIYLEPTPLTKAEAIAEKMPEAFKDATDVANKQARGYWLQQEAKRQEIEAQRKQSTGARGMGAALRSFDKMRGR